MKYIVWNLISPYDGYGTVECADWDEVCKTVKKELENHFLTVPKAAELMYKKWNDGHTPKITAVGLEIFVTTEPLINPVVDHREDNDEDR